MERVMSFLRTCLLGAVYIRGKNVDKGHTKNNKSAPLALLPHAIYSRDKNIIRIIHHTPRTLTILS